MRVVLAYASPDAGFAQTLRSSIQALGVQVDDSWSLPPGSNWGEATRTALEKSDAVLLVPPAPGTPGANNAFFEAGAASALGKQVFVIVPKMSDVTEREIPEDLRDNAMLDASSRPIDVIANTLVTTLKSAA